MAGTRAALTLAGMAARRDTPTPVPANGDDTRRGQTLRLKPAAWKQLKGLAIDRETTSHDLLIEAVNLLFERYSKPPIAG